MNGEQAALHDPVSAEVERQVAARLQRPIVAQVEDTATEAIYLATGSGVSQK